MSDLFTFNPPLYADDAEQINTSTIDHKEFKAAATETNEQTGSFVALVSTFTVDRQNERVMPGAFRKSLERWRRSGQMIPVMADHEGEINAVVGHIDPRLTNETAEGLEATGTIDTSTELGKRVYALLKKATLSWSIGFIVPEGGRRKRGKITEIIEVDLAEVSVVSVPANAGVRTLSIKSMPPLDLEDMTDAELKAYSMAMIAGVDRKGLQPITIRSFKC
ncbi:MAG: HK97 family phage prohead protease [Solirubrobacterales bacterium]